ncbi:MAG: hypothetical protein V4621_08220 [Pseudomonadota bacterium]
MARDLSLLSTRNAEIRKSYNKIKCEEQIIHFGGRRIAIKLSYQQTLTLLSHTYFISKRRLEYILGETEPKLAPIKSSSEQAETLATA